MKKAEQFWFVTRSIRNILLAVILACVVMLLISEKVNATENEYNLNKYNYTVTSDILQKITRYMQKHDNSAVSQFKGYMTADTISFVDGYTYGSTDISTDSIIGYTVDYVAPENSSTGDTVYFVNMKFKVYEKSFNIVKTFEFHINSDGKIYGINVWQF